MQAVPADFPDVFLSEAVDFFHPFGAPWGRGCLARACISRGTLLAAIPHADCMHSGAEEIFANSKNSQSKFFRYIHQVIDSGTLSDVTSVWSSASLGGSLRNMVEVCLLSQVGDSCPGWAVAYHVSRGFGSDKLGLASVPFGDLFNHSDLSWQTRIREDEEGFKFFAESDISQGEQIFNSYTGGGNDECSDFVSFFATHGFAAALPHSCIYLPLSWLDEESAGAEDSSLVKIDVFDPAVIPRDLQHCLPLPEFVPRLVDRLLVALGRFPPTKMDPSGNPSLDALQRRDAQLVQQYRVRLEDYRSSVFS